MIFTEILEETKVNDEKWNCVIPSSGGKDSTIVWLCSLCQWLEVTDIVKFIVNGEYSMMFQILFIH